MADTLLRSKNYQVELYVADKQCNPYNAKHATKHAVIPSLDVNEICKFAEANKDKLDFVLVGSENPIIKGIRDLIESQSRHPSYLPQKRRMPSKKARWHSAYSSRRLRLKRTHVSKFSIHPNIKQKPMLKLLFTSGLTN